MRIYKKEEVDLGLCSSTIDKTSYDSIIDAISINSRVYFDYKAKDGFWYRYRRIIPNKFVYAGKCYLYCFHELHNRMHTFRAWDIKNVFLEGNLLLAMTDMVKWYHFWNGETNIYATEKIG